MRKLLLISFLFVANYTFAQWYGGYPANVMMDPCVQAAIGAAQSSNWVMQNNQIIMQQQQMMMNNGWYSVPSYNQSSQSNVSESRSTRTKRVCGLCDGKGWVSETKGVPSFGQTKWCDRCDKKVSAAHYHATCPSCKGAGEW